MNSSGDTRARSIAKAVTWKLTAIVIAFMVSYGVSRDLRLSAEITGVAALVGIIAYYFHERLLECRSVGKGAK